MLPPMRHRCAGQKQQAGTFRRASRVFAAKQQPLVKLNDKKTQQLLEWAKASGIEWRGVMPAAFGGLRGLAASTSSIKADDLLISVPRQKAITLAPKQKCPCPDFVSTDFWSSAPWYAKIAVMLLNEQQRGDRSGLAVYLQSLPAAVDTPVTWSEQQLQQLQYPHLQRQVAQQRQEWQDLYRRLSAALQPGAGGVSEAAFFRAMALVRSRTFSGPYIPSTLQDKYRLAGFVGFLVAANTLLVPGADLQRSLAAAIAVFVFNILYEVTLGQRLKQYAMCPLIDLANHSSTGTSEVSYDFFRDSYTVAAAKAYAAGEQVFVSYGVQSNDSLMQYYGFAEPDNPADVYVMTNLVAALQQLQPVLQARLEALQQAGLLQPLREAVVTRQGFDGATLQAVRYLLASDQEAAGKTLGSFAQPGDAAAEQKLALALVHAVKAELASLGTTAEQDQQLLGGCKAGSVETAAIGFRLEKKRLLDALLRQLTGSGAQQAPAAAVAQ